MIELDEKDIEVIGRSRYYRKNWKLYAIFAFGFLGLAYLSWFLLSFYVLSIGFMFLSLITMTVLFFKQRSAGKTQVEEWRKDESTK